MRNAFNRYFNADHPLSVHTAFESGWESAPSYFWTGFFFGILSGATMTAVAVLLT